MFLENGKVHIFMKDCIKESIQVCVSFGKIITKYANTPEKNDLINKDEEEYSSCWVIGRQKTFIVWYLSYYICQNERVLISN